MTWRGAGCIGGQNPCHPSVPLGPQRVARQDAPVMLRLWMLDWQTGLPRLCRGGVGGPSELVGSECPSSRYDPEGRRTGRARTEKGGDAGGPAVAPHPGAGGVQVFKCASPFAAVA